MSNVGAGYLATRQTSISPRCKTPVAPPETSWLLCTLQIPDKAAYEDDGRHVQPDILVSTMLEVILNAHSASSHSSRGFVAPTRWASARQSGGPPVSRPALPSMQHLTGDTAQHSVGPPA